MVLFGKETKQAISLFDFDTILANFGWRKISQSYTGVLSRFLSKKFFPNNEERISYLDVNQIAITCEETSKLWYRAKMSREDIAMALSRLPVGSFIIRDSTSYPGYYGLAIKTDNSGVNGTMMTADSIRHFLIETSVRGARIKGSPAEPHYSKKKHPIFRPFNIIWKIPIFDNVLPHNWNYTVS